MRKQQKERARAEHTKKIAISQRGLEECACLPRIMPSAYDHQVPQRGEEEAISQDGARGGSQEVKRKQRERLKKTFSNLPMRAPVLSKFNH
jgi:hypothetical protein